jgi:hypothetical protein
MLMRRYTADLRFDCRLWKGCFLDDFATPHSASVSTSAIRYVGPSIHNSAVPIAKEQQYCCNEDLHRLDSRVPSASVMCGATSLTIVRAMVSGCGDGGRTTSYACFCYSSSTNFDYMISAQVASACSDQAQATSAQDVFAKYCQKGVTMGVTPAGKLRHPSCAIVKEC